MNITASGEVVWGIKKLNLALALDNTGSMASNNKMTELKKAAHNLLDTLKKAEKTPGDIKVSIVPFAVDVNVGTEQRQRPWIDWEEWDDEERHLQQVLATPTRAAAPNNGGTWTPKQPQSVERLRHGSRPEQRRQRDPDRRRRRGQRTAPTRHRHCPTAMMPLSTDWTALNAKIDAMAPTGNTNVTIGMQMAWQTLTPAAPFNAPRGAPDTDKVIILLTDGENTQNRWSSSTSSIDARTQKVCDNAKTANIKVYTVRVIDGNGTLLQACATMPDMYFNVQQASQLNTRLRLDRAEPRQSSHRQMTVVQTPRRMGSAAVAPNVGFQSRIARVAATSLRSHHVTEMRRSSFALNCAFSKLSRSSRCCGLPIERPAIWG